MALPPPISTDTRLFAVFGHPVSHSLSPAFQNVGLQSIGAAGVYIACDVPPEKLQRSLQTLSDWRAGGVNLTIPLKEKAFDLLDTCADSALFAGSVNTVEFGEDGIPVGHSTDGAGLHRALQEAFGGAFQDREVLILGCGGAGRAAALQAAREGAARIQLANRTPVRAQNVAEEIRKRLPETMVETLSEWPPRPEDMHKADLLIQSSSLGMKKGETVPFTADHFREGQHMLDMIYTSPVTPMMQVAHSAGAQVVNGIGMLLHQGVESLRIWTGQEPDVDAMRKALVAAVEARETSHAG